MRRPGNLAQRVHARLSLTPGLNLTLDLDLDLTLNLWRGSLLPLGSEAAPKKWACYAVQREQAPSPQGYWSFI
ncbi:UNVERIFIED_ORG: hypothetical protein J2W87_005733 [Pseudomonas putida]|nr:hypothetical protein [Pseudomonas putida]